MNNNTFWGIVGGIIVVWLGLLYFVIFGGSGIYTQLGKESRQLNKKLKSLKGFAKIAKSDPNKIPTAEYEAYHKARLEAWKSDVENTKQFFSKRNEQFESRDGLTERTIWRGAKKDAYDKLMSNYRQHFQLADDESQPKQPEFPSSDDDWTEKVQQWRIFDALVATGIETDVRVTNCSFNDRSLQKGATPLADFKRVRAKVDAVLPASQSSRFINKLLAIESINFEISSLAISKDPANLQFDLIKHIDASSEGGRTPDKIENYREPLVRLTMVIDALDWAPQTVAKKEEE